MKLKNRSTHGDHQSDDTDDGLELLNKNNDTRHFFTNAESIDECDHKSISLNPVLPAKRLNIRSTTRVVRTAFWIGVAALFLIIVLIVLVYHLEYFIPTSDGFDFDLHTSKSCDLMTKQSSAFQTAFNINLRGSTQLSFSAAKAIDVMWQLFVGMGGRLFMAYISYIVFMDGLTRLMEESPVPYQLYTSLTFNSTSMFATCYALKLVASLRGWRSKAFLTWFALSTTYVLAFPTLMSATAGYVTPSRAGFTMYDNNFVTPDSPDFKTCYQVNAGALIGLTNDTIAEGPPVSEYNPWIEDSRPLNTTEKQNLFNRTIAKVEDPLYRSLFNSTINDPSKIYDTTESTSPSKYEPSLGGSSYNWDSPFTTNITINGKLYVFHNFNFYVYGYEPVYCYRKHVLRDLREHAKCLTDDYFVWGLSSLMIYIVLALQAVWIFGMYIVWLDAQIYSALCRSGRKVRGPFRAALDVSEAMEEVLGNETCAYTNGELARALSVEPQLRYYSDESSETRRSHLGLSSRRLGKVPYNSTNVYGERRKDR